MKARGPAGVRAFALACLCLVGLLAAPQALAETITPIGEVQRGSSVTVQGAVERLLDEDEFRLTDASGSIPVYVGPNIVPAQVGEEVTVRGFVDDDFVLEIYAREMVLADGSVVRFDRGYE